MDQNVAALACIGMMLTFLVLGLPIAYAVGCSAITVGFFTMGDAVLTKLGWTTFQLLYNLSWTPLPLFTFMACLIAETTMGDELFYAARLWLSRLPGGLIVSSVMAEAGMSAALGSSASTILAVGKVAMPQLEKYKYDKASSLGAMLTGGILGPLIPPSTTFIIFAVFGGVSLGRLLIAGTIPGILLAFMLSAVPVYQCLRNPSMGPTLGSVPWRDRFASLARIWPIMLTLVAMIAAIFFGVATATEAAGLGCFFVLIVAVISYNVRFKAVYRAMVETVLLNATILFLIIGADLFSYVVGSSTLAKNLVDWVQVFGVHPLVVVACIQVLLLILGCFIDGMTIMMLTIPIFFPLVKSLGLDLIWFSVLFATNMELALITPAMGMNFFLTRTVFRIPTMKLLKGLLPYYFTCIVFLAVLVVWPGITMWLVGLMMGK